MSFLATLLLGLLSLPPAPRGGGARKAKKPRKTSVPSFRQAYRREKALLKEELQGLRETLDRLQKEHVKKKTQLEADVKALVGGIARRRKAADRLEEKARAFRRRLEATEDKSHVADSTLDLARSTLRKHGAPLPPGGDTVDRLSDAFRLAAQVMRNESAVRVVEGAFFDGDGKEVHGRLVLVGGVAALGAGGGQGGVLARGPEGTFELTDPSKKKAAEALIRGARVNPVPVYLFSPGEGASKVPKRHSFMSTVKAGGIVAWIILALAAFALLVVVERILTLAVASNRARSLMKDVLERVEAGKAIQAQELVRRRGALPRVLKTILENREAPRERLDELAAESILKETPRLERLLFVLAAVAAVAPLLGLLGTVSGMISTFRVITEYGTGDPKMLSGGISEALITTEFGLAVAIPVLLIHTLLSRWGDRIAEGMQTHAMSLINVLKRDEVPSETAPAAHQESQEDGARDEKQGRGAEQGGGDAGGGANAEGIVNVAGGANAESGETPVQRALPGGAP